MSSVTINLLPHQAEFIGSKSLNTGLIGGFGSGKTYAGICKSIMVHMTERVNVGYYLPTYQLIKDVGIPVFENLFRDHRVEYTTNMVDKTLKTDFGKIMLRSFDRPHNIVAYEVGYSVIDEADIPPKGKMSEIYRQVHGRNRQPLQENQANRLDFVSTPNGHKFLYDFFVTNSDKDKHIIRAKTDDNIYIPKSFIEGMQKNYSQAEIKAFRYGEFVNLTTGLVYRSYDKEHNRSQALASPHDTLHIGIDFNIGKMSAVICKIINGNIHVVDEIYGQHDTQELIQEIRRRYNNKIIAYPDASGLHRKTNSNFTDIDLLKRQFTVLTNYNPSVRNRVNRVNSNFCNDRLERRVFINYDKCPFLVTSLLSQVYDAKGKPDKNNDFDHMVDALGYIVYHYFLLPPSNTPLHRKYSMIR